MRMARVSFAERERELRILGNYPTKQLVVEGGEARRVGGLAMVDREREVENSQAMRGPGAKREEEDSAAEELLELVVQYKSALAELTFNSKPIITNLTIIAGENAHAAHGITKAICDHIITVPKEQKLPSLYLLDSIVKNIGGEYVKYFAARLPEVFCTAYRHVDPSLYMSMQHLFWTWRGVFPPVPLRTIETELQLNPKPVGPGTGSQPSRAMEPPVRPGHGIHVNPKYLEQRQLLQQSRTRRADGVAAAERNGDGQARQDQAPPRENSKVWSETQRSTIGNLNRERFGDGGYTKDYPDYEFERRGGVRPDLGNAKNLDGLDQGQSGAWIRDGDAGKGNGVPDERIQLYPRRNGFDPRTSSGPRPLGPDGQGYSRPSGPGRGGAFPLSVDPDGRGRGEMRVRRMDPRIVEGPDGRGHRLGMGSEGGEGRGYRMMDGRNPGHETGGRGLRMDGRGMRSEGRGLGPGVRGLGLDNRATRPDGVGLGADSRGSRLDRGSGGEVGGRGNWQNEEEEEYVWDDMKPQGRGPEPRVGDVKVDDWYVGDRDKGRVGSSSRPGMDSVGGLDEWRRVGSAPPADQFSGSVGMRAALRRESEERSRLALPQSGHDSRTKLEPDMESVHPTHSRLAALQANLPNFSMPLAASNVLPRPGTPPLPSSAAGGAVPGQYGLRHSYPPNPGLLPPYSNPTAVTFSQGLSDGLMTLGNLPLPLQQQQMNEDQNHSSRELPPPMSLPMFSLGQQTAPLQIAPMSQQTSHMSAGGLLHPFSQQSQATAMASLQVQQSQGNQFQQPTQAVSGLPSSQPDVLPLNSAAISELLKMVQQFPAPQNQMQQQQQQSVPVTQMQAQTVAPGQLLQSASGAPPLPNGPPPTFLQTALYKPLMQQGGQYPTGQVQLPPPMVYSGQQPPRLNQPPLPPGPPPQSALAVNSAPAPAPMNQYDTLFKSLLAQGLISASASTAAISVQPLGLNLQQGMNAVNTSSTFFNPGALQSGSLQTFSFSTALVSSVPSVTADHTARETDGGSRSSPFVVVKDDPIGTEFKAEVLKERHDVVLDALYNDFPRQCKTCGLRFLEQEAHSKHMDWHVSMNRRQKSQKKVSRKWFVSEKDWLSGTGASTTESSPSFFAAEVGAVPPKVDEGENLAVPADYNQSVCALCGEPFDDFYSDEKDEWMYKGAVYMNVPAGAPIEGIDTAALGPIVHAKCQTESAATADLTDDSEEVQPELMAADSVRMEIDGGGGDDTAMPLLDNFDSLESKDENSELESRKKRVRY